MYSRFIGILISTILLSFTIVNTAAAVSVYGRVTFVGTVGEEKESNGPYHAKFRFRLSESTCQGDKTPKERWIIVKSGRMDSPFQHNSANFRNAYNTVMSGFLARTVTHLQVDGVPSCDATRSQFINLWNSQIGLFP